MKKQTAVEELVEDLIESGYLSHEEMPKGLIFRAKAIEEEQIKKHTYQLCKLILSSPIEKSGKTPIELFEQYYNEIFKSE